jgi:hypothetical protein
MAGLLDDDLLRGLLGSYPQAGGASVASGEFRPAPNEGFARRIFGDPNNPADPRGDAISAISVGLLKRDLASAFEGANRAFSDTEDRNYKRVHNNLTLGKSALEMNALLQTMQRNQAIQQERQRRLGAQQFQGLPTATDSYGVPTVGDTPLFSLGSQPSAPQGLGGGAGAGGAPAGGMPGFGGMPGAGGVPGFGAGAGGNLSQSQQAYRQLLSEAELYNRYGDTKTALEYYQRAEQYKPKFSTTPQLVRDPKTNQLVQVTLNEDGGYQILPFGAKPDISIEDFGGWKGAVDKNATPDGRSWNKTMTPGEVASNNLGWANNNVSRERLGFERQQASKPQLHDGVWYVPPSAQNPQGATIQPQMPDGMTPKLTEAQGNATQFLTRMRDATRTLGQLSSEGDMPWPSTVERAGYKPDLPKWMPGGQGISAGLAGVNKAITPEKALQVRQAQDNWITANLRKESGAAIPPAELDQERAKWFPQPGEGEGTTKQKQRARAVAEEAMVSQAGPGGKLAERNLQRADEANAKREGAAGKQGKATPLPSTNPKELAHGTRYQLPNGAVGKWDSMKRRFEVE